MDTHAYGARFALGLLKLWFEAVGLSERQRHEIQSQILTHWLICQESDDQRTHTYAWTHNTLAVLARIAATYDGTDDTLVMLTEAVCGLYGVI